ncbi:glycosyltransferase family 2 protein [Microbacterium sp. NPDC058345]|uniref:glycosyltransferase family 2 protein n=1 Tax=Microbacterium sp. NPDC058345 TaxID=3346455 RepID=UPI00365CAEFA
MPAVRLSVVIPVRDDAALLGRCLEALRRQTRQPDEVIVVDNASSDASAAIARAAGARVVPCETPGIPAASAAGYDAAAGDLILRLDADCLPPSSWTEDIMAAFQRDPRLVAVTGGARFVDGPRMLRRPAAHLYLGAYRLVTAPALGHRPLFGSNMALRADAWRRVRGEVHRGDAETHDDLDLSFHLGTLGRIGALRSAAMGISSRPLWSSAAFARRIRRGWRTVVLHWPADFPPSRWRRLADRRRRETVRGSVAVAGTHAGSG